MGGSKGSWRQRLQLRSSKRSSSQAQSLTVPPSSAAATTQAATTTPAHSVSPHTKPNQLGSTSSTFPSVFLSTSLLQNALQGLKDDDRRTIENYLPSTSIEIEEALESAISATKARRQDCLDRSWKFTVGGRDVVLCEKADKVIHWLDRFKSAGDVAANADPVHIGLPWAGFRMLLEVALANSSQMAALLTGCETVLYMASRLKAYVEFWSGCFQTLTRDNLEQSITIMYRDVLQFLAQAIQIYETSNFQRSMAALWNINNVVNFEKKIEDCAVKVERDANNCSRELGNQDHKRMKVLHQHMQQVLSDLRGDRSQLQSSLDRWNLNNALEKIPYATGAKFESPSNVHTSCHPHTRGDILSQIKTWAQQPDGKGIFWLHGGAGAGKSTISMSIAQWLDSLGSHGHVVLGASFFFKKGEGDRGSATRFFPTIIRQLVGRIPGLDVLVADAVAEHPYDFDTAIAEQFRQFMLQPLQKLSYCKSTVVVVVDALDECENEADVQTILELWPQLSQLPGVRLRLFVTSRPEVPVRSGFQDMSNNHFQKIDLLDEIPSDTIRHDLSVYLKDSFSSIRKNYNRRLGTLALGDDWPSEEDVTRSVDIAKSLFIVAATISRLVGDLEFGPAAMLESILNNSDVGQLSAWESIYLPFLEHLDTKVRDDKQKQKLHREFRTVVGSIILLGEPLSKVDLATLLGESVQVVERRLVSLHSVLSIPPEPRGRVRVLHLSFVEFLLCDKAQTEFYGIHEVGTHLCLSEACLRLLSGDGGLCEDICKVGHPGRNRHEVDPTTIDHHLYPVLQYACRYWVYHVECSGRQLEDGKDVHLFLEKHFLHWLEALSFMGQISEGIRLLRRLRSRVSENASDLPAFIEDAIRFLLAHRYMVGITPLQLYSSAIIFTPTNSLVRKIRGQETSDQVPSWIRQYPMITTEWGPEVQKLEGHSYSFSSVAFSPNTSLLASGSHDETVRLWDAQTGQALQVLKGHSNCVTSVTFSSNLNGSLLASGSADYTVQLWDTQTGEVVQELKNIPSLKVLDFKDNTILMTDTGPVSIGNSTMIGLRGNQDEVNTFTMVSNEWIQQNNQNLLWLPPQYRGMAAFSDTKVAIGAESGLVSIFHLDYRQE